MSHRILLRSGWQSENIGDIAHTPGMLLLLEKYLPTTEVTFWPFYSHLPPDEVALLTRRFPKLKIAEGKLSAEGKASTPELALAFDTADLFLHNSGPATLGWADAAAFKRFRGKPFGVYGVSYGLYGIPEKSTLSEAAFVYFRDSASLAKAREDGVSAPVMGLAPDAAFAMNLRDSARATAYLKANSLTPGKFLVCLPKHRLTPAWLHVHKKRPFDPTRHARNEAMKEHDHAPLIEAIVTVTRKTDLKILIGHEDETELSIGKTWLYDKLPEDVKAKVVWRNTLWSVDEALGIYAKSAGLFGHEMHSPILCVGNGIPAIVCRWEEQSTKGLMWRDIGLAEWLFDFDNEDEVKRLPATVLALAQDLSAAKAKTQKARAFVQKEQRKTMTVVKKALTP